MKLQVVTSGQQPAQIVEANLIAGTSGASAPEVLIGERRLSLEQVAQTYAIVEATRDERSLLYGHRLPTLLAFFLRLYQELEELDDQQLATYLGCRVEDLARLGNYPEPREAPLFRADVENIVKAIRCSQLRLVKVIRHAQVMDAFRAAPPNQGAIVHMRYRDGGCEWRRL